MKKTQLFLIFLIVFSAAVFNAQKKYIFDDTQLTKDKFLLISHTDMYCSYEIKKRMSEDIIILGSNDIDEEKTVFTTGDNLIINKGEENGFKIGDKFILVEKGSRIMNPFSNRTLGTLFLKKGIGEIRVLYDNQSIVEIKNTCFPIHRNNFLIPYKEEEQVVKRSINYKLSRLPESQLKGRVIFSGDHLDLIREMSSSGNIVAVDLGKGEVSKGDFVLFYKIIKKGLPEIITGSGIVIQAENTNSTVKIIDSAFPIETGTYLTVLPEAMVTDTGGEKIPVLKDSRSITEDVRSTEESFDFTTLFPLDEYKVKDDLNEKFLQMKEFIDSKSEYVIILRGYACSIGSVEHNLELSKNRVDEVKDYIIKNLGIDPEFIESYFYGEKDTPFDNTTEINRRKNRRVDIQVLGK